MKITFSANIMAYNKEKKNRCEIIFSQFFLKIVHSKPLLLFQRGIIKLCLKYLERRKYFLALPKDVITNVICEFFCC